MVAATMERAVSADSPIPGSVSRHGKILLVGCGSGACAMVKRIESKDAPRGMKTLCLTSDDDSGRGSGSFLGISRDSIQMEPHPEVSWSHYEDTLEQVSRMMTGADITVIVMSLGGDVGTAMAPIAAKAAFMSGAASLGFAVMPFSAEKHRHIRARHAIGLIRSELTNTVVLENDKLVGIARDKPVNEAFGIMDDLIRAKLCEMLESMAFEEDYVEGVATSDLPPMESGGERLIQTA